MKRRVLVVCAALLCGVVGEAQFAPPTGIYSLGRGQDLPGSAIDDRLANIRDYGFLSGFTLRLWWRDIEPTQGAYDFGVIDEAFQALPAGQRINLEILDVPPDYVLDGAASTYLNHRNEPRPTPWDGFAQERQVALFEALSTHTVDDGLGLALNQHPVLAAANVDPVGLNFGVRDLNNGLRNHPEYTQQRYVDAVVDGVAAGQAAFPDHEGYLFFFALDDGEPGPRVDKRLIELFGDGYNGPGQPSLSLFIENLSDVNPAPSANGTGTGSNLLDWANRGGGTMMQALDSWKNPRPDRLPLLESRTPAKGIELSFENYGTKFYELYILDLDGAAGGDLDAAGRPIEADLLAWNSILTSPLAMPGDYNRDGGVDEDDFDFWESSVGQAVTPHDGADGNGDGVVDERDRELWEIAKEIDFFVAIPEAGGAAMVVAGSLALNGRRRVTRPAASAAPNATTSRTRSRGR